MATETTTLTIMLDHLYYLTSDSNNDTGYTLEEVQKMIDEKGGSYEIEATITHPVPPPYTVEWDIEQHEARIENDREMISQLTSQLSELEEESEQYIQMQEQITALEQDIEYCEQHIQSLQS